MLVTLINSSIQLVSIELRFVEPRFLFWISQACLDKYKGDGKCDDVCNIEEFDYDGGDCCLNPINHENCQDCICHLDNTKHDVALCTNVMKNDEYCHDECNFDEYDFDNGQCCISFIVSTLCSNCICHADNSRHSSLGMSTV